MLSELAFDPVLAPLVAAVKEVGLDERLDGVGEDFGLDSRLNISNTLLRLLAHDVEGRIDCVQTHLDGLLDAEVSNSDGIVFALSSCLQVGGLMNLANNLAALLTEVDADREELGDVNVLVPLKFYTVIRLLGRSIAANLVIPIVKISI